MAGVRLVGLTKRFREVIAVNNVNLEVKDREFLVLVGPSGCGKTTCLRMIAGLEEVTEGEIYIGDRLVNDVSPKDRDIAMVFQNYALYPHMSVYDNLAFGLRLRMLPPWWVRLLQRQQAREIAANIDRRVRETAHMLRLEELLHRKPKQLSGGQRQRVALGRAIVREPKVFLMDEPLSNLDAKLRVQTRAELIKLHRRLGITTIYVTHDQVEAMTMGDRIAVMRDGVIQQVDTPLGLYEHPRNRFVAEFIGSPQMNVLENVRVISQDGVPYLDAQAFRLKVPPRHREALAPYVNREVLFGIRPEDIYDRQLALIPATADNTVRAEVDVREPMGSTVILELLVGPYKLTASVDAASQAREAETMEVCFDLEKAHIFDPETEEAIV
ncbi:MAG TPA: ABC transporter ATP-binding protein [Armatimonadetes bacterium]|nr:ABC transporter ATP-binding protein [Armatimonadota bacterium]